MLKNDRKKSERTREHLMGTALQAFERRGYDVCTMRGLAKEAGVTAPGFYYYFKSKEDIVAAYYQESLVEHLENADRLLATGAPITDSLEQILHQRFLEFAGQRKTLRVLRRFAFDKDQELSPFHNTHRSIRRKSVDLFERLVETSNLKWPAKSRRALAQMLWQFHLAILLYWIGDDSNGQKNTQRLLKRSLAHLAVVLKLLRLPGALLTVVPIFETLKQAGLLEDL